MQSDKDPSSWISGKNLHLIMTLSVVVLSLIIIIMAGAAAGPSKAALAAKFRATMSGDNEIPPVNTTVSGYTAFRTASNDTIIKYKVNVTGLYDASGADIYQGNKSQNGDIIVDLLNNSKKNKIRLGMAIRGNISDTDLIGPMEGKALDDLLSAMKSGDTYVNIITDNHASGVIRGQIESESGKNTDKGSSVNMTDIG